MVWRESDLAARADPSSKGGSGKEEAATSEEEGEEVEEPAAPSYCFETALKGLYWSNFMCVR